MPISNYLLNLIFIILVLICQSNFTHSLEINDDFTFCDPNERTLIDINNSCKKSDHTLIKL